MRYGTPGKTPLYYVGGEECSMYFFVNEDGRGTASSWVTGRAAFKLKQELKLLYKKDKKKFVKRVKELHKEYSKNENTIF